MPEDNNSMAFAKALEALDPIKLAKANVSRRRFELRQLRLQRQQLALQKKRSQQALDPMARALAKAKALANQQDS